MWKCPKWTSFIIDTWLTNWKNCNFNNTYDFSTLSSPFFFLYSKAFPTKWSLFTFSFFFPVTQFKMERPKGSHKCSSILYTKSASSLLSSWQTCFFHQSCGSTEEILTKKIFDKEKILKPSRGLACSKLGIDFSRVCCWFCCWYSLFVPINDEIDDETPLHKYVCVLKLMVKISNFPHIFTLLKIYTLKPFMLIFLR